MDTNHYTSKILRFALLLSISGIISHCSSQSCRNEGAEVQNRNGETCFCINGRMRECCRVRRDFTSMSRADRARYVRTVRRAQTDRRYRRQYRELITMHRQLFHTGIHQRNQFLPWHRWYLLRYENLLRRIDSRVTLPYWDWSIYSMRPWRRGSNSIWFNGASGLGGNGAGRGRCIANGPFSSFRFRRNRRDTCITRRFNGRTPDIIAVYLNQFREATTRGFTDFELNLRVNLHDTVHCRVGGIMCGLDSAQAPEFFLHHGFIDKIWANWQEYSVEHRDVHFSNLNRAMRRTGLAPSQFTDTMALPDLSRPRSNRRVCVYYEDPTIPVYAQIIQQLDGMTREQIMALPRHSFAPVNNRQMRFFGVNRQERQQARTNLRRELEPQNEIRGTRGLRTSTDRNVGFPVSSLGPAKRSVKRTQTSRKKKNSMSDRWLFKVRKTAGLNDTHPFSG